MKKQDILKSQRNKERRELYGRFNLRIIRDFYIDKLYKLFDYSCFNCGYTEGDGFGQYDRWNLVIDHNVPLINGGHYELGNLVVLCRKCNGLKHDKNPSDFYEQDKLEKLSIILNKQIGLFDFTFNWDLWNKNKRKYLISIGIDSELVKQIRVRSSRYYVETVRCSESVVISFGSSKFLGKVE